MWQKCGKIPILSYYKRIRETIMKKLFSIITTLALLFSFPAAAYANVETNASDDSITLSWQQDKEATGYYIYTNDKKSGYYSLADVVVGSDNTQYKFTGLEKDKTYWYKIRAYYITDNDFKFGEYSDPVDERVKLEAPDSIRAKAVSDSTIKISWDKVEDADGYKVYRYNSSKEKYTCIKTVSAGTTAYKNTGLSAETKKSYKVAAYTKEGSRTYIGYRSDKASATTDKSQGVEALLDKAESKLGCAYVSGAAGPNSFDCSGFVHWVFKNSGVSSVKFSRSSAQGIYSSLKRYDIGSTSLANARKGDILFFGSGKSNIWHTSIYYGNSKQIHAFSTWGRVAVNPVSMSTSNKKLVAIVRLPMK